METIATLERVREAQEQLMQAGQRPSADKILSLLGGGSKTTVLAHMRTIADEAAKAAGSIDVPQELLLTSAGAMARKLWEEASRQAKRMFEARLEAMLMTQAGMYEDLKAAYISEEKVLEELQTARQRIVTLEGELTERAAAAEHLHTITEFLKLREHPQYKPIIQLLRLLEPGGPRDREEVFRRMGEVGHTRKQAATAWNHALEYEYATEATTGGRAMLVITDVGRDRLRNERRTA